MSENPPVYVLNMTPTAGQFNKKIFGKASCRYLSNKTIMLVGATGSGKTTLINGMINYVLGVDWNDNWRFKLIHEETNKSQAHSQTSDVTAYQIYHTDEFQVPYSLTIIDTPGFGDTRGIKEDKEIKERIRQFFTNKDGINTIDAVCFVVQAALARLTQTQKYIFRDILSVFGKDIANNIITLVTFADNKTPPVLQAIKEANIQCATEVNGTPVYFKVNSSALFANNIGNSNDEGTFDHIFWKMGKVNMKKFFTYLDTMETKSLTLTKQVLHERKQLEKVLEELRPLIQQRLSTMAQIRSKQAGPDSHKMLYKENQDFDHEDEVGKPDKICVKMDYVCAMNCKECKYTCHYPCAVNKLQKCSVIQNNHCRACPGKCALNVHEKKSYEWKIRDLTLNQAQMRKYKVAMGNDVSTEQVVTPLREQYDKVKQEVTQMMHTVTECLDGLRVIALQSYPWSTSDYIGRLIISENQEARPGFQDRVRELEVVRDSLSMQTMSPGPKGESPEDES